MYVEGLMPRPSCSTCYGFGLWFDTDQPMGRIDAREGLPTKPCPECKADKNPDMTSKKAAR